MLDAARRIVGGSLARGLICEELGRPSGKSKKHNPSNSPATPFIGPIPDPPIDIPNLSLLPVPDANRTAREL